MLSTGKETTTVAPTVCGMLVVQSGPRLCIQCEHEFVSQIMQRPLCEGHVNYGRGSVRRFRAGCLRADGRGMRDETDEGTGAHA